MKHALFCLVAAMASLSGCQEGRKAEVRTVSYSIELRPTRLGSKTASKLKDMSALVAERSKLGRLANAELIFGGEPVATLELKGDSLRAEFQLTSARPPSEVAAELEVRVETVCGHHDIALKIALPNAQDEAIAAGRQNRVSLSKEFAPPKFKGNFLYIDPGKDPVEGKLRIGTYVVPDNVPRAMIIADGCPDKVSVKLGEKSLGTWRADYAASLVSFDRSMCHRILTIAGDGSQSEIAALPGEHISALSVAPDEFLRPSLTPVPGKTVLLRGECE